MTEDLFPPFQEELTRVAGERTAQAFGQQVLAGIQSQAAADIMAQRLDTLSAKFDEASGEMQKLEAELEGLRAQAAAPRPASVRMLTEDEMAEALRARGYFVADEGPPPASSSAPDE